MTIGINLTSRSVSIFNFLHPRFGGLAQLLCLFAACLVTGNLRAADPTSDFSDANKLYAEGRFSAAVDAYGRMIDSGIVSPGLLFNDGNAEFKSGNLGNAIVAFRQAQLLAPRDPEIRANLDYVRNQVQGATLRQPRWQEWLSQLTLNEWTRLTAFTFWIALILFSVRQIRPALTPKLKGLTWLFVLVASLSGAVTAVQAADHFSNFSAVVTGPGAIARSGPFDDAQVVFPVHDGAELPVLSRHGDWIQINDGIGKIGWLKKNQVQVVPAA